MADLTNIATTTTKTNHTEARREALKYHVCRSLPRGVGDDGRKIAARSVCAHSKNNLASCT